jgi:hypothetical protein
VDFYDPSSGSQVHDFNPGIKPNGVFWIVPVPDGAVQITGDTLTLHLDNVAVVDQFQFPGGTGHVPTTLSFDATYVRSGKPRQIVPASHDPLSAFHWAGSMSDAANSGTFSVSYVDGSFSASGSFNSSGSFGEMGTERNGVFVNQDEVRESGDQGSQDSGQAVPSLQPADPELVPAPLRSRIGRANRQEVLN